MKMITPRSMVWLGMWAAVSMTSAFANTPPCQGQIVFGDNGNNLVGEVTAIYGQKAEVRWFELDGAPYSGDRSYWDLSSLSIETECSGKICKGRTVFGDNGNSLVGKVVHTFENGKVEVKWTSFDGSPFTGNPSFWDASSLSGEVHCSSDRICEGNVVYGNNGNDLVGTVHRVFENNKVEVAWSSLGGSPFSGNPSFWDASELFRETRCSHGICEGDQVYGDNGNNLVGTADRIFKNGKAEVRWTEMNGQPYTGTPSYWDVSELQKRSGPCGDSSCHR